MLEWLLSLKLNRAFKGLDRSLTSISNANKILIDQKAKKQREIEERKEQVKGYGKQIQSNQSLVDTFSSALDKAKN